MSFAQVKEYLIGVLKGWFKNKNVLDKFSEDNNGNPLYNGNAICNTEEEIDVEQAIIETLAILNQSE